MPEKKSSGKQQQKSRNWAFVAYPDSVPADWKEILKQTGVQFAISPLHDKDIDPNEDEKKPHWHIIMAWGNGSTTYNVAERVAKSINGTIPIALAQIRGYYRYLTHKDNPEKFQYDEKNIITFNGFSILDFVELTKSEVHIIKKSLISLIQDNDYIEYVDFIDHLLFSGTPEQFDVGSQNTLFFNHYLTSRRNKMLEMKREAENETRRRE